jgi:hypothetical protein
MANPMVEEFLRTYLPFLAAAPKPDENGDGGFVTQDLCLMVIAGGVVLFLLFGGNWLGGK